MMSDFTLSKRQPALVIGSSFSGLIAAVIVLLIAFGVPISEVQATAILGVVAALTPIATALVIRTQVYSPATVQRLLEETEPPSSSGDY